MDFSKVTTPEKANLLISFMDIQGFLGIARKLEDPLELFALLNDFAKLVIDGVEGASGRVIKFIGDSALLVFPEDAVDQGVLAILALKGRIESYLAGRGFANKLRVTAHFGEAAIGIFGHGHCAQIDVLGESVNAAAVLERSGQGGRLVISPQAFRKLSASTRKLFHKLTPPVVYLAEER